MVVSERLARSILLKKNLRSDAIWTRALIFQTFLARIPLWMDLWALQLSQYWERGALDALAEERLRRIIRRAQRVPMWRRIFEEREVDPRNAHLADLAKLPIISKKTFLEQRRSECTDQSLWDSSVVDRTSGSTGQPFTFLFDRHAELRSFAVTERLVRIPTKGRRFPIIYMRSRYRQGFTFAQHSQFFLRGYNSVRYRMRDLAEVAKKYADGFVLYGYTSSVLEVARQATEQKISLPLAAVMATGEAVQQSERAFIERELAANFYLVYASREAGWLAFECEKHALHLNEEWAYVEIVDAEGMPVSPGGEGRIVVTTFDNRVMPLIRYDIGDRGTIITELCACGRTLRCIKISGRQAELIQLDEERSVSLLDVSAHIDAYSGVARQFQLVQTSSLSFTMRVVPGPFYEEKRDRLHERLVRLLHPQADISWEIVAEIEPAPSGKAVYFIKAIRDHA